MKQPVSRLLATLALGLLGGFSLHCATEDSVAPAPTPSGPAPQVVLPTPPLPLMRDVRSYQLASVPPDFPVMMGCSDEELVHPDPFVHEQGVRICEAAQAGLYDLSQNPSLSPDAQHDLAAMLMGTALEKLAALREGSQP